MTRPLHMVTPNKLQRLSIVILGMDILAIALMFPFRHQGIQFVRGQSGIDLRARSHWMGILLHHGAMMEQ